MFNLYSVSKSVITNYVDVEALDEKIEKLLCIFQSV